MAQTQIRGNTQLKAGTITNAEINAAAAIASTKLATFTADRNAGGFKLTNLATPTVGSDAVTKTYADSIAVGSGKLAARLKTTGNVALTGTQTIDGVAGTATDRIFAGSQTAPAENGLYDMAAGAWARSSDADTWNELVGAIIPVSEGATQADTVWLITADKGGTLGTTAVGSAQLPGPSDIIAGTGLTRTGQTLNVGANADSSIVVNPDDIQVKRDGAGALSVSASGIAVAVGAATGLQIASNTLGIKLNGSSLTLGASGLSVTNATPNYVTRETPTGAVNDVNTTFTLANTPTAGAEEAFLNGILQEPGAGNDYTISGATITYLTAPATGDKLRVSYRY